MSVSYFCPDVLLDFYRRYSPFKRQVSAVRKRTGQRIAVNMFYCVTVHSQYWSNPVCSFSGIVPAVLLAGFRHRDGRKKATKKTRRSLVEAAFSQLSAERSFASLSLREVAREAGIAPTFLSAFPRRRRTGSDHG